MAASHSCDIRRRVRAACCAIVVGFLLQSPPCIETFQSELQYFRRPHRPHQDEQNDVNKSRRQQTSLQLWGFGSDNKSNSKKPDTTTTPLSGDSTTATTTNKSGTLGGVAGIMDSMDGFKTSQRIGKRTGTLVQELMMLNVEGVAENGRVKVTMDGQQRPVSTYIDEAYLEAAEAADVASAITIAMKDAHTKSTEKMDEKIKNFLNELGLPG